MVKTLGLMIGLGMAAMPAFAQNVSIDYAKGFDFKAAKTFQSVETKESNAPNELMDGRVKDALVTQLTEGGLKQGDAKPDLFVTYHFTSKENTVYNTTSFGYGGVGLGWDGWGGGMGSSTTTATKQFGVSLLPEPEFVGP
jgi:hypothetical protein